MLFKSKNGLLKILGLLILFGGIVAGLFLISKRNDFYQKAAPSTSLYFKPSSIRTSAGSLFRAKVYMDTGSNLVNAVDYRLTFDPNIFKVSSITKNTGIFSLSQDIKNEWDNNTGQLTLTSYTLDPASFVHGSRLQAFDVEFYVNESVPSGVYYIDFGSATAISAFQEKYNVLIGTSNLKITVSPPKGNNKKH